MSARGYALHSVCSQLFHFLTQHQTTLYGDNHLVRMSTLHSLSANTHVGCTDAAAAAAGAEFFQVPTGFSRFERVRFPRSTGTTANQSTLYVFNKPGFGANMNSYIMRISDYPIIRLSGVQLGI